MSSSGNDGVANPAAQKNRPPGGVRLTVLPMWLAWLACLACLAGVGGCAASGGRELRGKAASLAATANLTPVSFQAGRIRLVGYARGGPSSLLTVYIEGDGRAYLRRDAPSSDPTPADPLALRLAARDPSPSVLYLARPCQFLPAGEVAACDPQWWTLGRYSPEVVAALGAALNQAKVRFAATRLRLVGYSGGGALAVLVAAGRTDVAGIATVAANLDTDAWTTLHGVSPLALSQNPADAAARVAGIPQVHFAGSKDGVTPPALCQRFLARMPAKGQARCLVIEGADHHAGLVESWDRLVLTLPPETPP